MEAVLVIHKLEQFIAEKSEDWLLLDELIVALFEEDVTESGIEMLLKVTEAYPDEDGCEVFWSIIHGLESVKGYECYLIESVKRQPSLVNLLMINRLLNGGTEQIQNTNLLEILQQAKLHPGITPPLIEDTEDYLNYQITKKLFRPSHN